MLDWNEFSRRIESAKTVMLTTHVRPDGDALGSQLGMRSLLAQKGKEVFILNPSPTPSRYRFLDPDHIIGHIDAGFVEPGLKPDAIIVLDTGTWSQLPGLRKFMEGSSAQKIVIDHHQTQDELGALRLVDVAAPACGMLVFRAIQHLGVTIDSPTATALFVAIATDTGWMHHPNSTPEVFSTLGALVDAGAKPNEVYRQLYETNSRARLRLLAKLLEKIEIEVDGRLAWAALSQADIADAGAHPMDTEDFIVYLMSLSGVESAVFLIEQRGGDSTKVSFRSRGNLNCSKLAEQFGGGGHRPAAGATLPIPLDRAVDEVIRCVEKAMADQGSTT